MAHCTWPKVGICWVRISSARFIRCGAFAPQILVEQSAVLDQDDRFALENLPEGLDAVRRYDVMTCRMASVDTAMTAPVTE
jgi:hypothetical protein